MSKQISRQYLAFGIWPAHAVRTASYLGFVQNTHPHATATFTTAPASRNTATMSRRRLTAKRYADHPRPMPLRDSSLFPMACATGGPSAGAIGEARDQLLKAALIPSFDLKQHVADGLAIGFGEVDPIAVLTIDKNIDREIFQRDVAIHPDINHVNPRKRIEGRDNPIQLAVVAERHAEVRPEDREGQ